MDYICYPKGKGAGKSLPEKGKKSLLHNIRHRETADEKGCLRIGLTTLIMVKHVIKRDGRIVDFDKRKIVDAVLKAMDVTEQGEDIVLAAEIAATISKIEKEDMSVEDIQDVVEMELMNSPRKEVAKKYIAYRNQRNLARKAKSREIFKEIIEAQATDVTRENANMNADTPAGMMMKFASESTKSFVDECLLSEEVKDAVKNGYIHIHDKDYYPTKSLTCVQHPLDKILKNGFFAGHGESRPAKRIETASILGCISMETVQNEMHGGQAIPAFDFYMAPFTISLSMTTSSATWWESRGKRG